MLGDEDVSVVGACGEGGVCSKWIRFRDCFAVKVFLRQRRLHFDFSDSERFLFQRKRLISRLNMGKNTAVIRSHLLLVFYIGFEVELIGTRLV